MGYLITPPMNLKLLIIKKKKGIKMEISIKNDSNIELVLTTDKPTTRLELCVNVDINGEVYTSHEAFIEVCKLNTGKPIILDNIGIWGYTVAQWFDNYVRLHGFYEEHCYSNYREKHLKKCYIFNNEDYNPNIHKLIDIKVIGDIINK